jgi:hypothetical protein
MSSNENYPDALWKALGRNLAAGFGALSALLSLLAGASVSTACFRGAITLFGVLLATRLGTSALQMISRMDQAEVTPSEATGSGAVPSHENDN